MIDGMAIAGLATGAGRGFVYVRSEYPHAIHKLESGGWFARQQIATCSTS
ncbi:MAG TPA: hypothetical protein VHG29_12995 [Novosphingobium sp.]|nr:hypothetical protein [Novosphingobium sp.]